MQEEIVEQPGSHEPTEYHKTPKKRPPAAGSAARWSTTTSSSTPRPPRSSSPDLFFPDAPGVAASFATFGVGYVARPIGAVALGHWGDKHGRKNVLVLCMLLMGASTFLVGLLPTYAAIGIWAPIFLVALRLIQGFAVGGEISGASAMIVEHAPFGRRGAPGCPGKPSRRGAGGSRSCSASWS
jgi:MFS family permease